MRAIELIWAEIEKRGHGGGTVEVPASDSWDFIATIKLPGAPGL